MPLSLSGYAAVSLLAFLLTVLIELAVAFASGFRDKRSLSAVFLVNVVTQPALNLLLSVNATYGWPQAGFLPLLVLEALAVIVEWRLLVYALRENSKKMFALSFFMNAASCGAGFLIGLTKF